MVMGARSARRERTRAHVSSRARASSRVAARAAKPKRQKQTHLVTACVCALLGRVVMSLVWSVFVKYIFMLSALLFDFNAVINMRGVGGLRGEFH